MKRKTIKELASELKEFKTSILKDKNINSILVVIGPEGGISPKEEALMEKAGFLPITLGPRILRTEVAPTYIMSAISYELELGDDHEV